MIKIVTITILKNIVILGEPGQHKLTNRTGPLNIIWSIAGGVNVYHYCIYLCESFREMSLKGLSSKDFF